MVRHPGLRLLEDHRRAPAAPEKPALYERIEPLRFATGDEALRAEIYATHGEALYTEFAKRKPAIEAWLKGEDENEDDDSEDSDSGDDGEAPPPARPCPPSAARSCSTHRRGSATRG
jgi:hypothetical protein